MFVKRMTLVRSGLPLLVLAVLLLGLVAPTKAQDTRVPPPTPRTLAPSLPPGQVVVELQQVDAVVNGPVATVHVTQVLRNDSGRTAEGVYLFPLPVGAAVSDFQLTVNGQTLEGKLLDRAEARRIYEEIVRRQLDPALLEYIDRGVFQASVFPIPAGETRKVAFTYNQVLPKSDGLYRFNFPIRTHQYSAAPVEQVKVSVELVKQPGLRTLYSPNYPIRVERTGDDGAVVTFDAVDTQLQSDLDLYFGVDKAAIGLNLLSYKPAGEDGYFLLLAAPGVDVAAGEIVERDLVLVVDVSGSMEGEKLLQAQAAAQYVVEHLNPVDHFNLIAFSSAPQVWQRDLQAVDKASVTDAVRWIGRLRASGSTDINRALLEVLALFDDEEAVNRSAYVLFLTDGQPTLGETEPDRIVDNALNNRPAARAVRLFPFGIGYDVNTDLLDVLGQQLGGRASYVEPGERIDEAVSSFYAQISTPVLANVSLDFGDKVTIEETFPYPLPDLFAGEQLVMAGRYREGGKVDVELSGAVNGKERLYVYPKQPLVTEGGEPLVARLWATRKIGALLEQIRRSGPDQEVIDAIVDLSMRYGVVTPYTAYLVEEPGVMVGNNGPADGGSVPLPRSLAYSAHDSVAAAASQLSRESAAGAVAVQASKTRDELQRATSVVQADAVRYAGGRAFQRQGELAGPNGERLELWVDTAFVEDMDVTTVAFGSEAYFDLISQPGMAAWLAISPELVVVTGEGEAMRITTAK